MSGHSAQDDGAWMDSVLQDLAQSSCDHSNLKIQLKRVKSIAKRGDSQVEVVFTAAWDALRSQNSMVRACATLNVDFPGFAEHGYGSVG